LDLFDAFGGEATVGVATGWGSGLGFAVAEEE